MVDDHDERIVLPFQAWLVREIITNSANSANVLTERDPITPPSSGFHLSLFANYTLDGVKATFVVSVGFSEWRSMRRMGQPNRFHGRC